MPEAENDAEALVAALEALPAAVRAERERRGLSLRTAAAEMGTAFNSLTRLEQGRNSTLAQVRAAAEWLTLSPGKASGGESS